MNENNRKKNAMTNEDRKRSAKLAALFALKLEKTADGKTTVWKDKANNRTYGRIIGGIAWPGADSYEPNTHLAILGEDMRVDDESGKNLIWILHEEAGQTIEAVMDRASAFMDALWCKDWVLPQHEPEYLRVDEWVRDRKRRRMPVPHLCACPLKEFVQLNALMQARTVTNKTFFFGDDSVAAQAYIGVPDEDFYRPLRKYPQIGCVLYPFGYLEMISKRTGSYSRHKSAEGGY